MQCMCPSTCVGEGLECASCLQGSSHPAQFGLAVTRPSVAKCERQIAINRRHTCGQGAHLDKNGTRIPIPNPAILFQHLNKCETRIAIKTRPLLHRSARTLMKRGLVTLPASLTGSAPLPSSTLPARMTSCSRTGSACTLSAPSQAVSAESILANCE
eukprot:366400-Chlamydomonas_euryale.AAC.8